MSTASLSSKKGAVIVEAALTIPLLLLLFFGVLFGSIGFTSYGIATLDTVNAYVYKDAYSGADKIPPEKLVHGHNVEALIDVPANDPRGIMFANLASGRASARNEPFGSPLKNEIVKYRYSTASKQPFKPIKGVSSQSIYSVKRVFIPWFKGFERAQVNSAIVSDE